MVEAVGRIEERTELTALVDGVAAGSGQLVVVTGEAGIGKTTLVEWLAAMAVDRGLEVQATGYDELGGGHPLRALWRLVFDQSPVLENWLNPAGQYVLVESLIERIQERAAARPQLIILDDLQWADSSTVRALPTLVGDLADHPVLWVLARRPNPASDETDAALRSLQRKGAVSIDLGPLSSDDLTEIAGRTLQATADEPALIELLDRAGGNPQLAKEALLAAERSGALRIERGRATLVDSSQGIVPDRVPGFSQLPAATRDLVTVASIFGRNVDLDVLAAIAELDPHAAWRTAAPAVEARLLEPADDGLRFCHDLICERLRRELAPAQRVRLHQRAAELLAAEGAHVSQIEHHLRAADRPIHSELAATLLTAGAETRHSAPAETTRTADLVRSLATDPDQVAEASALLAETYIFTGQVREAEAMALAELSAAAPEPSATRLRTTRASAQLLVGRMAEAATLFEEVARTGDARGTDLGVAAVDAAVGHTVTADLDRAEELVDGVLNTSAGPAAIAYAQSVKGLVLAIRGDVAPGLEQAQLGVAVADAATDLRSHRNLPLYFLGQLQVWSHALDQAEESIRRGRAVGSELGLGWHETYFHVLWAQSLLAQWRLDEAEATARAGLSYAHRYQALMEDAHLHAVLAEVAIAGGDFDAARAHLAEIDTAQQRGAGYGADVLFHLQAMLAQAEGRHADAHATLSMLWDALVGLGVGIRLWQIAPDVVATAMDVGDEQRAADVVTTLESWGPPPAPHLLPWLRALQGGAGELREVARSLEGRPHVRQHLESINRRLSPTTRAPEPVDDRHGWRAQVTKAEARVLDQLARGATNRQIAETLHVSRRTVESHLYRCYAKLGVDSRVELVLLVSADSQGRTGGQ